jgi:hypothetical protein
MSSKKENMPIISRCGHVFVERWGHRKAAIAHDHRGRAITGQRIKIACHHIVPS